MSAIPAGRCRVGWLASTRCWRSPTPRAGHGIIQYNVGRDPRWEEYEALVAKSGRPLVWTALLAGSLGPNSHRPQLAKAGEQIARGLPIYPQGACRPIQIEFDFHSPVVFDTWASFAAAREA